MDTNFLKKHYSLREAFAGVFVLACVLYAVLPAIPAARLVKEHFPYTPQYDQRLQQMYQLSAKMETLDEVGTTLTIDDGDFYRAQYAFAPRKVVNKLNTLYVLTIKNSEDHPGFILVGETELYALYRVGK
jgi:hypothetical protein